MLFRSVGEAENWEEAIGQSRSELSAFEEENPLMSGAIKIGRASCRERV